MTKVMSMLEWILQKRFPRYQQFSTMYTMLGGRTRTPNSRSATARDRMRKLVGVWSCWETHLGQLLSYITQIGRAHV